MEPVQERGCHSRVPAIFASPPTVRCLTPHFSALVCRAISEGFGWLHKCWEQQWLASSSSVVLDSLLRLLIASDWLAKWYLSVNCPNGRTKLLDSSLIRHHWLWAE